MCRLIFINTKFNKNILNKFFEQSIKKKYTPQLNNPRDQDLHLDGFGFIWLKNSKTFMYKNHIRPDMDYNLDTIVQLIQTDFFIGHLRATKQSCNTPVNYHSTHPFNYKDFYFCHNGSVENFTHNKKIILDAINIKYYGNIKSNCDSEYLFFLLLSIYDTIEGSNNVKKLKLATDKFFVFLKLLSDSISANIILKFKDIVIISRFINNKEEPPSLYRNENCTIISSEPINDNEILVKKNTMIIISRKNKKFREFTI